MSEEFYNMINSIKYRFNDSTSTVAKAQTYLTTRYSRAAWADVSN